MSRVSVACTFVDFFLQPIVSQLLSFLQDSTATIREFEQIQVEGQMSLVTCDVESLYTNIAHVHGMEAVAYFLRMNDTDGMFNSFLIDLLDYILQHNHFIFNGVHY